MPVFIDIHCHIVPNIDDGATNLQQSVRMARTAFEDGTKGLNATPHESGSTGIVTAKVIKKRITLFRDQVNPQDIELTVLPGAEIRINPELPKLLKQGKVLTLADRGKHVLLEMPHDTFDAVSVGRLSTKRMAASMNARKRI